MRCVSTEIAVMFDDDRHPIVAFLAWQQCDTEVNQGIDTCCNFIHAFFYICIKMKQTRGTRSCQERCRRRAERAVDGDIQDEDEVCTGD